MNASAGVLLRYGMSFKQKYSKHVRVVVLSVKPIFLIATMRVANRKQFEMQKKLVFVFGFVLNNCVELIAHTCMCIIVYSPRTLRLV